MHTHHHKDIIVIYHDKCPDGFGAAYAAWKKFGDTASYIPASYGDPFPEGLDGRDIYIVDYSFEEPERMSELARVAKRFVVLDHHHSAREVVESIPEHVFDENKSGATIAWTYFHPNTPTPKLLLHIEDGDLYRYALSETRDIFSYFLVLPNEFEAWDAFARALEDEKQRPLVLVKAATYTEFFNALADSSIARAKLVRFEGYETYFAVTHPNITMKSYVANRLYTKLPPIALAVTAHPNGFGVSIRSDGSVDVSQIAKKYGGGGHPGSSGFFIPNGTSVPWEEIKEHSHNENPRH